ncbi:MAG: hypothetical protein JHD16_03755 [Solirubrobacteraceae bacterium]|nr:hypothetical protein [Solirubrobacteraceae bacterium]
MSGPLAGVLTAPQLTQLERAAVEQVNLGLSTSTEGTPAKSVEQVKQACSALDTSVPLLAAFERTCAPSLAFFEAAGGLATGCLSSVGDECGDALDALNAEVAELSATTLRMHDAVAAAVKDPACREQLGGTTDQMAGVRALPKATADAAKAARANDPATQQEALTGLLTTLEQIGGKLAPADYVAALRRDCGLPDSTPLATPQSPA